VELAAPALPGPLPRARADGRRALAGAAAGADAGGLFSPRDAPLKVKLERVRALNTKKVAPPPAGKPVILWMDRDHRVQDNWALLYAQQEALAAGAPLAVCFALRNDWSAVGRRQVGFMLRGLEEVEAELKALSIPMFLLPGEQCAAVAGLAAEHGAGMVVCDFSPLREERAAREAAGAALGDTPLYEVDAANVVPVWLASDKQEVGARTLRPKITKLLPKFLEKFPAVAPHPHAWAGAVKPIEWEAVRAGVKCDEEVAEVEWAPAGHAAGMKHLEGFIKERFGKYGGQRNDPGEEGAISDISPWIRFGQISAARCALEAKRQASRHNESYASFIEELVVRRELSDNFCFYQPRYDSLQGCAQWAQDSLALHAGDDRKKEYGYLYDAAALEAAKTHDKLWNAAQKELVHRGKMHGFMRMYWAKKILEWTKSPEEALRVAIFNNDKYALDGRCPNGFVGCMWSIGGVHDMGWKERPVFGKIRYMNYAGCQRKFKIDRYVMRVDAIVKAAKLFVLKK
jgi:deoxyribodipyrimidine photo-lyase